MDDKGLTVADALALRNGNDDFFGGGNGAWWIIIFFMFFLFGGNGFGFNRAAETGIMENYTLNSDFANIERKIDSVNNGLCDGFYAQNTSVLNGIEKITSNTDHGFANLNQAITTTGYDISNTIQQSNMAQMQGMNSLQNQMSNYHYDTKDAITGVGYALKDGFSNIGYEIAANTNTVREGISGINYNLATNTNTLQNTIQNTGFSTERQLERGFCDTNFNLLTQSNNTLQAIDKVGDRIIDYLANEKVQTLRDENQNLRLAASQSAQNNYLISQLSQPVAKPAYLVCNPNGALNYSLNYNQGSCNCM